jgi:hypothetical protein
MKDIQSCQTPVRSMNMYEIGGCGGQQLLAVRRQNDIFSVHARSEIIIDSCVEIIHFKHGDIVKMNYYRTCRSGWSRCNHIVT